MQTHPPVSRHTPSWAILCILLVGCLAACAPLVREGQTAIYRQDEGIRAGQSAGQTFLSTYAGLNEIRVFLAPDSPGEGRVVLRLRADGLAQADLATASIPVAQIDGGGYYSFRFDPRPDSFLRTYYLQIDVVGSGAVRYGSAGPTDYLNGSLYQDGQPVDGQLAFQLAYDPPRLAGGLLREGLTWLGWLLLVALFFVLPGYAVLRAWSPGLTRVGAAAL
ncbi:MAG TPA: hypothetical protein PJ988_18010, partial [Anaerolinea sp.]|nr:hypothetical protein [Anaerolinea sp.]